jgi:hypothetical protein
METRQVVVTREQDGDFDWNAALAGFGSILQGTGAIVQGANAHKGAPPQYNNQTYVLTKTNIGDKLKSVTPLQWALVGGGAIAIIALIVIVIKKNKK